VVEPAFLFAMHEGFLTAFQNVRHLVADRGDVGIALRFNRHFGMILGRRTHTVPLRVAKDRDVRVVGCARPRVNWLCTRCNPHTCPDTVTDLLINRNANFLRDLQCGDEAIRHLIFECARVRSTADLNFQVVAVGEGTRSLSFEDFMLDGPTLNRPPVCLLAGKVQHRRGR
jgi:hypothetical protein